MTRGVAFLCVLVDSIHRLAIIDTRLGDVAQLGERCRRMAEAEGSTPFVSTLTLQAPTLLGLFY